MYNPLEQFSVRVLCNSSIFSITNITLYVLIVLGIYIISNEWSRSDKIVRSRMNYIIYKGYKFTQTQYLTLLRKSAGIYFPLINSIFFFILINNLIGLIPYSFTTTSQIIVTLTLSIIIIGGITILGINRYRSKFYKVFIPSGLPKFIIPIIFIIEIVSYISRIVSLSVRLFANMVAGHTILYIIATATGITIKWMSIIIIVPLIPIIILEIGVAIIQAFVFAVLTGTYIKDMVTIH